MLGTIGLCGKWISSIISFKDGDLPRINSQFLKSIHSYDQTSTKQTKENIFSKSPKSGIRFTMPNKR